LAVEDETTVSRRGTSSRGGRKPPTKKETNSNSTANKKSTTEANSNKYSSEESSDVSSKKKLEVLRISKHFPVNFLNLFSKYFHSIQEDRSKSTKPQPAKRRKKTTAILSDSD
jgi:hypothetical protein